ncbi:MAG: metal ABC transporter permease [bacterium]
MLSFLSYGFMQRALVVGLFISAVCAILGVFLILRRDAMIGHGLAHMTFAGVALGLFLHVWPMTTALAVAVLSALGIIKLREKAGVYEDTAIGIFSSIGMASGIVLVSMARSFNVSLMSYLFGNILAISPAELWVSVALTGIVLFIVILFYQDLLFITFDSESAKSSGIKVSQLEMILAVLTAITAVLGMKVVGLLLVAALLVIPSAAGLQIAGNFHEAMVLAVLIAVFSVTFGLVTAFYWDLPASGAIILFASLFFISALAVRIVKTGFA